MAFTFSAVGQPWLVARGSCWSPVQSQFSLFLLLEVPFFYLPALPGRQEVKEDKAKEDIFFFFWLFPLGVATADHTPPSRPIPRILLCHPNHSHIFPSSLTASINLRFGLPLLLPPGGSMFSILLPTYPASFLST